MIRRLLAASLLAAAGPCSAWSPATADLARRAQAEFPLRIVIVASLDERRARALPEAARAELADAERRLFPRAALRGVATPFRLDWFDDVRCAVYVPRHADAGAEFWALAHEVGHCVARLTGLQETLWRQRDLDARHRAESFADAFATHLSGDASAAERALRRRAVLNDDAAYMTDAAIRCALAAPAAGSLASVARTVDAQLRRRECLADPVRLRATEEFLGSIGAR